MRRRLLLLLPCALWGCSKVYYAAPDASLDEGVYVEIDKAFVRGKDRVYIDGYITNNNKTTIRVDKDEWILKLPTGEMVSRRVAFREGEIFIIGPGQGQGFTIDFHKEGYDLSPLTEMTLIVGGVQIGESSTPYVVGDVVLRRVPESK